MKARENWSKIDRKRKREQLEAQEHSECERGETTASEHTYASELLFSPLSSFSVLYSGLQMSESLH